nr:hypothetical protein [Chloroflexota bacterium]
MQVLGKLMGDPNKKELKLIQPAIDKINALEPAMKELSDEELAAKTVEFRAQLAFYLKGGLVLEDELLKLFREALDGVEQLAEKCSDAQLREAISEHRQKLERRSDREAYLSDHLQDTLSECFETAYERLNPSLNELRVTAAMDLAEKGQEWPDEAKDPEQATIALLREVEPALKEVDDDQLAEAFQETWPRFEEARRNAGDAEEGADERLEQM